MFVKIKCIVTTQIELPNELLLDDCQSMASVDVLSCNGILIAFVLSLLSNLFFLRELI